MLINLMIQIKMNLVARSILLYSTLLVLVLVLDPVQDESCPQVHSTPVAKWVSSTATNGTSTLRRGLVSTLGFQIFHNWFL